MTTIYKSTRKWKIEIELIDTPTEDEGPLSHDEINKMLERCLMQVDAGIESKIVDVKEV